MTDWNDVKAKFLAAPDGQLDPTLKSMIEAWSVPPTALQILRVLDEIVYTGGGSDFMVHVADTYWKIRIEEEGTTPEAVIAQAEWRKDRD